MMNKRGQAVLYIYFFIAAIIIVVIAAVLAPMGVLFNSEMYEAGEDIMLKSQDSIADIDNVAVREQINASIQAGLDAGVNNIEVNAAIFQYSWVIVILLTGLIVFMQSRKLIEVGAGGFI